MGWRGAHRRGHHQRDEVRTDVGIISETNYGYTNQETNSYIKLMFFKARWYSPELGRFVSPDTIVPDTYISQNWNRFSYTRNNPIRFTDPSGHRECGDGEVVNCDGTKKEYSGQQAATWAVQNMNDDTIIVCTGLSCTEYVSKALNAGGMPEEPEKEWVQPKVSPCYPASPWDTTDLLYDYLTDQGWGTLIIPYIEDKTAWNDYLNDYFSANNMPPGAVVLYETDSDTFTFIHAGITTGKTATFEGVTGAEIADSNGFASDYGPHMIGQTSAPFRIVILIPPE